MVPLPFSSQDPIFYGFTGIFLNSNGTSVQRTVFMDNVSSDIPVIKAIFVSNKMVDLVVKLDVSFGGSTMVSKDNHDTSIGIGVKTILDGSG